MCCSGNGLPAPCHVRRPRRRLPAGRCFRSPGRRSRAMSASLDAPGPAVPATPAIGGGIVMGQCAGRRNRLAITSRTGVPVRCPWNPGRNDPEHLCPRPANPVGRCVHRIRALVRSHSPPRGRNRHPLPAGSGRRRVRRLPDPPTRQARRKPRKKSTRGEAPGPRIRGKEVMTQGVSVRAIRNPRKLSRSPVPRLKRSAERRPTGSSSQEPPRSTRRSQFHSHALPSTGAPTYPSL